MNTNRTVKRRLVATCVALGSLLVLFLGGTGSAAADPRSEQDAYVASLLSKVPYSYQDDYVRTLVFWHHHPDWTVG